LAATKRVKSNSCIPAMLMRRTRSAFAVLRPTGWATDGAAKAKQAITPHAATRLHMPLIESPSLTEARKARA
jgi:hypothetical protein